MTLWLTGLPCSGKTTLGAALQERLAAMGARCVHLDGDVLRRSISSDLGFSRGDRILHVDRVAALALELNRQGRIVVVSLISPYAESRARAREKIGAFAEIYLRCPVDACERRDVKGMYALAREGKLRGFTGVSDIYEEPANPELVLRTDEIGVDECVRKLVEFTLRATPALDKRASRV